jgi:hypothetical protein
MPVQGGPSDTQFSAEVAYIGPGIPHGGHRKPQLSWCHLGPSAPFPTPCARGGKPCAGALGNQVALELSERGKYAEDQLSCRRSCVDSRSLTRQNPQTNTSECKVMHHIHEVSKAASQPIELPDHQRVALPKRPQACSESGSVILLPGSGIAVEVPFVDACSKQRISL